MLEHVIWSPIQLFRIAKTISLHDLLYVTSDGFRSKASWFLFLGAPHCGFCAFGCDLLFELQSFPFFLLLFPCQVFFLYLFICLGYAKTITLSMTVVLYPPREPPGILTRYRVWNQQMWILPREMDLKSYHHHHKN
jgi:hypothetical protein